MTLTARARGEPYCPYCGEIVQWARLSSGRWVAVQEEPVLYLSDVGTRTLLEYTIFDANFIRNCLIYEPRKNHDLTKIKEGYMPHVYVCPGR